jgi:pimeloyl-ACP methyl ester carboxylesterase
MKKIRTIILVTLLSLVLLQMVIPMVKIASAATTYTQTNGTLNGANYIIRIPSPTTSWNRDLVVFCRGYFHDLPADPMLTSNSVYNAESYSVGAISAGAAFAISDYGFGGYCIREGMDATYQLTQYAKSTFNVTGKVYLEGISMGGCVALMLGQKYPNMYSGVLDICGAKDLAAQYELRSTMATLDDSGLTAKLQTLGASVPPYPFSLYPSSMWGDAYRAWCSQAAADMVVEFGGSPNNVPQAYQNLDPIYHANISIPVITVQGTSDGLVPYARAVEYQTAVIATGKSNLYRMYSVNGGQHGDSLLLADAANRLPELFAWANTLPIPESPAVLLIAIVIASLTVLPFANKKPQHTQIAKQKTTTNSQ